MTTPFATLNLGAATHCRVTIPLPAVDNDGQAFAQNDITWFEAMLLRVASGWRKHYFVDGAWDSGAEIFREPVAVYETTISREQWESLRTVLEEAQIRFRQHVLLAEVLAVEKVLFTGAPAQVST